MSVPPIHFLSVALVAFTLASPAADTARAADTASTPTVENGAPCAASPRRPHHAWREQLTPEQRAVADAIIDEARQRLRALRQQVRDKVRELKGFAYAEQTDPDVLPRLGRELQGLRDELHREIMTVRQRISEATGVSLGDHPGRGCSNLSNRGY